MKPPYDICGQPILPHSLFLYSASQASSNYLFWGRVVRTSGQSVTFQGIDNWHWEDGRLTPRPRPKLTTMSSPEKIIVLPWSHPVPPNIRHLLDPAGDHARALALTQDHGTATGIAS